MAHILNILIRENKGMVNNNIETIRQEMIDIMTDNSFTVREYKCLDLDEAISIVDYVLDRYDGWINVDDRLPTEMILGLSNVVEVKIGGEACKAYYDYSADFWCLNDRRIVVNPTAWRSVLE